jgi:hypothetical protein
MPEPEYGPGASIARTPPQHGSYVCPECDGHRMIRMPRMGGVVLEPCPVCGASGWIGSGPDPLFTETGEPGRD